VLAPVAMFSRVLLVARGVGDDELALLRRVVPVGHVDGDALLALGLQAIDEQSEVGSVLRRTVARGVGGDGREVILVDHLAVVEEEADEGALPVIDRAARDETQELFPLVLLEAGDDVFTNEGAPVRHQK